MIGSTAKTFFLLAPIWAGLLVAPVFAAQNPLVEEANALYRAGKFQEALEIYNRVAEEKPESPELEFNRGAAQFQLGDLASARNSFEQAGVMSERPEFQALSSYNLGNCAFREAETALQTDPEVALESLNKSLGYYRDALARDSDLQPAAHNLELAKRTIQQVREQMKQQQQQQQEQQKKQEEMKKELDELIEDQEQQNQKSQEASEQMQDPAKPDPEASQMDKMAEEQQETREKTEALSEQMKSGEGEADSPLDAARKETEAAAEKQKEAEENLGKQKPEEANRAQEEALEKLKQAREALDKNDDQQEEGEPGDQQEGQSGGEQEQPQQESEEQSDESQNQPAEPQPNQEAADELPPPDATARDILNQEKRNKEMRALRQMVRIRPVEKDW